MANIILPAKIENLEKILNFVQELASNTRLEKKDINQVMVSAEEAAINIINYAYPEGQGNVSITCDVKDNKFIMIMIDQGIPFDPLSVPEPDVDLPITERKIGGLGIFMIKKYMTEVMYRREGNNNIFTMIKNIA